MSKKGDPIKIIFPGADPEPKYCSYCGKELKYGKCPICDETHIVYCEKCGNPFRIKNGIMPEHYYCGECIGGGHIKKQKGK